MQLSKVNLIYEDGKYYISTLYEDNGKYLSFPKAELPFDKWPKVFYGEVCESYIDYGFGKLLIDTKNKDYDTKDKGNITTIENNENIKCTTLSLEKSDNQYILSLHCEQDTPCEEIYYNIPKIIIPIDKFNPTIITKKEYGITKYFIDFGINNFEIKEENGHTITVKRLKKTKKMTLKEIEEVLGYKVEIVNDMEK